MKKLLIIAILSSNCFANNNDSDVLNQEDDFGSMFGSVNRPQINGIIYDGSKPYIEPNQGYSDSRSSNINNIVNNATNTNNNNAKSFIEVAPKAQWQKVKANNNFQSNESWVNDTRVERALKNAATNGKLSHVLDRASQKNLPATVAIVPIVETNYNKNAISPKGAGGAWQLMPGTAKEYGLSEKDRFDFESSTKVAIEILSDLYKQFGNWTLAFAAYNCGTGCVMNALKKNPNAKSIDELSLPKETITYVHKIIAFNQVIIGLDNRNSQPKK